MSRFFVADGRRQPDPDANLTIEQVRDLLADFLPELVNASWTEQQEGEDTIIVFQKRVGVKGATLPIPPPPRTCKRCGGEVAVARTPDEAYCLVCGLRIAFDRVRGEWLVP